jgi:hypothetical protein
MPDPGWVHSLFSPADFLVDQIKDSPRVTRAMIALPLPMTRANNPPTSPALAAPTGQAAWPQNGHTDELA